MWIIVEVEDIEQMRVIVDEDEHTLIFDSEAEAQNYAERHCLDGRVVEIEE